MRTQAQRRRPVFRCLLGAAALVMFSACQLAPHSNLTRDDVKAKALDYLHAKYGRTFKLGAITWGEPWGDPIGLDGKQTSLDAYPAGGNPGTPFIVEVDMVAEPIAFHDHYVEQLVAPEYERRAAIAASAVFPGSVIAVYRPGARGLTPPDSLGADTTFEQFRSWADKNYKVEFCAVFPLAAGQDKPDVQAKLPTVVAALKEVAGRASVSVKGFAPDVFTSRVLPATTDAVRRANCMSEVPVAPVLVTDMWEV